MYRRLLCMNANEAFVVPVEDQILMLKSVGFEGFFTMWDEAYPINEWATLAREQGMIYQSLHAPFDGVSLIWHGTDEEAREAIERIISTIKCAAENDIKIVVCHCYIGFDGIVDITEKGIERFGKIVAEAEKCGVNIAFENTEGLEYLQKLFDVFGSRNNVGFCLDTGHEMCYNFSEDLLERFGDKLIATHLNDNLGIKDFGGKTFWHDDLHLLPFDGIRDWDETARRFKAHNYDGILTFELCKSSKPNRHENDKYERMSLQDYFTECYIRACRFASKLQTIKQKRKICLLQKCEQYAIIVNINKL